MEIIDFNKYDEATYYNDIVDFLPRKIIDIHTHIFRFKEINPSSAITWASLVATRNTTEDLENIYTTLLPKNEVIPLIFALPAKESVLKENNDYVSQVSKNKSWPALYFSDPKQIPDEIIRICTENSFIGLKSYLTLAPSYIPKNEISIYDFFPKAHFIAAHEQKWLIMLHLPRAKRLSDKTNIKHLKEIDKEYPSAKVIVAHIGRAYTENDAGNAFEELSNTKNIMFDFSANTNENIIKKAIASFGPERVMFGSDLPITRMKAKRIIRKDTYVNLVPKGLYGNENGIEHLEGVVGKEKEKITYLLYEEILSVKKALKELDMPLSVAQMLFYENAKNIINKN